MKKTLLGLALAATTLTAAPAAAHDIYDQRGRYVAHSHSWDRNDRYEQRRWERKNDRRWERQQYRERYWVGSDRRVYCRRPDGTTGIVVGAAVGALLGHQVERGEGTIIGGAIGAILGREIERGNARCLRRR